MAENLANDSRAPSISEILDIRPIHGIINWRENHRNERGQLVMITEYLHRIKRVALSFSNELVNKLTRKKMMLEVIKLKKDKKLIADIAKKQHNSIMELICSVREISEKLQEINDMGTRSEMKESLGLLNDLILLRLKRAKNYVKLTDQQIDGLD